MWNSFGGSLRCRVPAAAHSVESTITGTQIQLEMGWKIIQIIQDHPVQLLTCHLPRSTKQNAHQCYLCITCITTEKVAAWLNRFFYSIPFLFLHSHSVRRPPDLLLLIPEVKKANTISCTDKKQAHTCACWQRTSTDKPALPLVPEFGARLYLVKSQL